MREAQAESTITAVRVGKSFATVRVLNNIDLEIKSGEVHALVGANGAGKSTFAKILCGAYPSYDGQVLLNGHEMRLDSPLKALKNGISCVYQEVDTVLMPRLSVAENLLLYEQTLKEGQRWIHWRTFHARAQEMLTKTLNMDLSIDVTTPVRNLPLAQKQLIVIARAIAFHTKFLILDEPTSTLSHKEVRALFELISSLCKAGVGIFYISHRMPEVFEVASKITVFRDGLKVDTVKRSEVNLDDITFLMLGRKIDKREAPVNLAATKGERILRVQNLCRKNKVDSVTFDLFKGEILCITGLAGAGKSELARLLFGVEPMDQGELWLGEEKLEVKSPGNAVGKGIFLIPEERRKEGLLVKQTLGFNLSLCTIGKFCGLLGWVQRRNEIRHSMSIIQKLNIISAGLSAAINHLSGGNQQKVNIGKWILRSSLYQGKVFIFDEPTKGVDVGAKEEIYKIIRDLAREGYGVIFISPEIPEVLSLADRILVMANQRIVAQMDKHLATEEQILKFAIGGMQHEGREKGIGSEQNQ